MPLSPPATIGAQIAADIKAISATIPPTGVTDAILISIWAAVMTRIYADLALGAAVAPGSFIAPPLGGPVTGVGGPIT